MEVMKPWQQGHPLAKLKALAAPFKAHFKPYVYGAFGIPNEQAVADALTRGRLQYAGRGAAALLGGRLKNPGRHTDFAGNTVVIPAGAFYVEALAWQPGEEPAARGLLDAVFAAGDYPVWFELHEEDAASKQMAADLGFAWQVTKISAGSTITGLYAARSAPARGFTATPAASAYDPSELPGLAVLQRGWLSPDTRADILAELAGLTKWWADHYSSYNKGHAWSALALRGYDSADPAFIIKPAEMSKKWKAENPTRLKAAAGWTAAAAKAPKTLAAIESLGRPDRIRFMRLQPGGGELTRHADITDREAGVADGKVTRLHIPLQTNRDCKFQSWDARGVCRVFAMPPRSLCYLDQRKPHACCNGGTQERIHLVVDVYGSENIRALIRAGQ